MNWKYPDEELPEDNILVLCFTGSARFGAYVLGERNEDSNGECDWYLDGKRLDDAGFGNVIAWCHLPDAPDFNRGEK